MRSEKERYHEIVRAENRLRVIEKISKYREDKIKKEYMKLEEEMQQEELKQKQTLRKEIQT